MMTSKWNKYGDITKFTNDFTKTVYETVPTFQDFIGQEYFGYQIPAHYDEIYRICYLDFFLTKILKLSTLFIQVMSFFSRKKINISEFLGYLAPFYMS